MQYGVLLWLLLAVVSSRAMNDETLRHWREDVKSLFYHGFDNYMRHGFPEDEVRPLSCKPLTRDNYHPDNVGLNDVLGNISLTLIDSLSTLAILASDTSDNRAIQRFQDGVSALVRLYGDGTAGHGAYGERGRGFDVDSKVQVFETTIRGVGGLISAHLFAVGELPIVGYNPLDEWQSGMLYSGQLLRLAQDLAERLLPAFYSPTGIPYPRVNLRYGIPFYSNSPLNQDAEYGQCQSGGPEITETCSAGAGSLILEFTTLSRLTGDPRFENAAKRAFLTVWTHRSNIGLVGSGIDAESGIWTGPFTGIGAGIDSFYEYALKTHILLSGLDKPPDPDHLFPTLADEDHSDYTYLDIWNQSHAAIRRNLWTETPHPHYINVHLSTGSPHAFWIDSLSAYFPGLLALAGELEEATTAHMLYTALWTRFSALPERWSIQTGNVEGGLGWWGGRPELAESNYYLYQATEDPWYLHVGSMIVADIKRRCWAPCGLSGLQDVQSGEMNDRMETFFLSETAKYLYLLFDKEHPLNKIDSSFVFTTEGHPLVIPRPLTTPASKVSSKVNSVSANSVNPAKCPVPPRPLPFSISNVASRKDLFHASHFARLHLTPQIAESARLEPTADQPSISIADLQSPSNYSLYPWTLPTYLLPSSGQSAKLKTKKTFDIQFPTPSGAAVVGQKAIRVNEGILINSLSGLGLGLVQDVAGRTELFRVHRMGNIALGRDEKIFLGRHLLVDMQDPSFSKTRDLAMLDLVISTDDDSESSDLGQVLSTLFLGNQTGKRRMISAAIPVGLGATPPPDVEASNELPWRRIFYAGESCSRLPAKASKYDVIVIKRGGCSFSAKLANIPSSRHTPFVIIVSYDPREEELIRPLLDEVQYTPGGLVRHRQLPMVLVGGGQQTYNLLVKANGIGLRRRYQVHSDGVPVSNVIVI